MGAFRQAYPQGASAAWAALVCKEKGLTRPCHPCRRRPEGIRLFRCMHSSADTGGAVRDWWVSAAVQGTDIRRWPSSWTTSASGGKATALERGWIQRPETGHHSGRVVAAEEEQAVQDMAVGADTPVVIHTDLVASAEPDILATAHGWAMPAADGRSRGRTEEAHSGQESREGTVAVAGGSGALDAFVDVEEAAAAAAWTAQVQDHR